MAAEKATTLSREFQPYISSETRMREFTLRAVVVGTVLGTIFGASSLYLVLKVGLTVSASIPVAVISITLFRLASKFGIADATILENTTMQTAGSAGESVAFGIGVTMPAIMILGFDLEITRVMLVAVLGGLLGILMMIPLRRALIVAQHGELKYPEGTACAEVLKAGASEDSKALASDAAKAELQAASDAGLGANTSAKTIFAGFAIGLVYNSVMKAFKGWKDTPEKVFGEPLKAGSVSAEITPELLGVGYIIGPQIASIMCAGGVLSYLVLIPLIKFFGSFAPGIVPPGTMPISEMGPAEIRSDYILYIGAGAVTAGGIISLFRSLPTIWHGLKEGLRDVGKGAASRVASSRRVDQDLPMKWVGVGLVALLAAIMLFPQLHMNFLGAILIIAFGFLFVTVSSRLTGEVGSSSNPISGMAVATLLLTCIIFLAIGWTGGPYYVTALSVGAIVCIAASNGGTTSQDLKTGFLVGATPKLQQMAILIAALVSALLLGPILLKLNKSGTVYVSAEKVAPNLAVRPDQYAGKKGLEGPQAKADPREFHVFYKTDDVNGPAGQYLLDDTGKPVYFVDPGINGKHKIRPDGSVVTKFDAPKATLMSYIIKGILDRRLPWGLVLFGALISCVLELSGVGALAFAVGLYLPISTSTPIWVGGLVRWWVDKRRRSELKDVDLTEEQLAAESDKSPGVLMASGYIAGGAIAGILIAFMAGVLTDFDTRLGDWAKAHNPLFYGPNSDALSLIPFAVITALLYLAAREVILGGKAASGRT